LLIFFVLSCVLTIRLFFMQVVNYRRCVEMANVNRIRIVPLEAERGKIFDRNLSLLADNKLSFNLSIVFKDIPDIKTFKSFVKDVTGKSGRYLSKMLLRAEKIPYLPSIIVRDLSIEQVVVIEQNRKKFPGMFIEAQPKRIYPFVKLSQNIIIQRKIRLSVQWIEPL